MYEIGRDEDGVAGPELAGLPFEPLLDSSLTHPDDLLLLRMLVEVVAEPRLERDVDDDELLGAGGRRMANPAQLAPVEALALYAGAVDERPAHLPLLGVRAGRDPAPTVIPVTGARPEWT